MWLGGGQRYRGEHARLCTVGGVALCWMGSARGALPRACYCCAAMRRAAMGCGQLDLDDEEKWAAKGCALLPFGQGRRRTG